MTKTVILYDRGNKPHDAIACTLESAFSEAGHHVYVDRHLKISVDWARSVEEKILQADNVISVYSARSLDSEMLEYELEIVGNTRLKNREMRFICVPVGVEAIALGTSSLLIGGYQTADWKSEQDNGPLIAEILEYMKGAIQTTPTNLLLGATGGGVSADSPYYIVRSADLELRKQLEGGEPTTLIKGARQSGKTSLIARGIRDSLTNGFLPVVTDFQRLGSSLYGVENDMYQTLAGLMARQMNSQYDLGWDWTWDDVFGAASNLDDFVRCMLGAHEKRVVWFMDEADRLFSTPFADSFFAIVRSWHNARALSTEPCWSRLSIVIAYATEAHLFIQDINQSPFNVGYRIDLHGFTLRQTEELNGRYGEPLRGIDQVYELHEVLDGQPYLTRTAFDWLVLSKGNLSTLLAAADRDDGPFGDHLRRVLVSVNHLSVVREVVDRVLSNARVEGSPEVDRLVAAGILVKNSAGNHVFSCKLYRKYLERHLK